jgi:hypothetical protein
MQSRKRQIQKEIAELCDELQQIALVEHDDHISKLTGKEVLVVTKDQYQGKKARVIKPWGKSSKPMYWILRVLDTGEEIRKARSSFKLSDE